MTRKRELVDEYEVRHPNGQPGIVRKYQYFTEFTGGGAKRWVPAQVKYLDDKERSVEPLDDGTFKVDQIGEILSP